MALILHGVNPTQEVHILIKTIIFFDINKYCTSQSNIFLAIIHFWQIRRHISVIFDVINTTMF